MDEKKGVCRVCLSNNKKKYVSLFEKHKGCYIYDQINAMTNVQMKENDGLPDKICKSCLMELETAFKFKQKCESSNIILLGSVLPQSVEGSLEIDVKVKKEEPSELLLEPQIDVPVALEPIVKYNDDDVYEEDNAYDFEGKPLVNKLDFAYDFEEKPLINKLDLDLRKSRAIDLQLECNECGKYFKSKCKLRVHWNKTHLTENLLCHECKRRFKSVAAFKNHQQNKKQNCLAAKNFRIEGEGKNRVFYCKMCDYKSLRIKDIMTHWVTHTGDRPYKCDLCSKTCTQLSSLTAHKEAAHKEYKVELTCQYCGKLLKGRNKIYRHLKTHTDKGVPCEVCQKVLKNRSILAQHMQRHSGYKSYTCEKCAQSFYTFSELSNHKRQVHNNNKNLYKCNLCEYKAKRKESVKKHETKHIDGAVPCTVCGMFFESAQKLLIHQRRHFEEKKYPCPYCEMKFFRRDTVPKHVKSKHGEIFQRNKRTVGLTDNEEFTDKRGHIYNVYVVASATLVHCSKSNSPTPINDEDIN